MPIPVLLALTVSSLAPHPTARQDARCLPVVAPVRDAGVLHLATGAWTRRSSAVSIGADVVYDNTCPSGYYLPLLGETVVDEGRLPSPTSPSSATSRPGCATHYTIDGLQIAYCTDRLGPQTFELAFYASYAPCSSTSGLTPTAAFALTVPGSPVTATSACWIVNVDLEVPSAPSLAFAMAADGDGVYAGLESENLFGWSIRSTSPANQQNATGPFFAGDPATCGRYDGTRWDSPVNYAESGTGMGTVSGLYVESTTTPPGCFFTGTAPFGSLHLELYADACAGDFGIGFCYGFAPNAPCPCANHVPHTSPGGCANSLGIGGLLRATGSTSLSNDTARLLGSQMPANAPTLYFQGTTQQSGGVGVPFGDGLRCAGGSVVRLGVHANSSAGESSYPIAGDASISVRGQIGAPGTRTYQAWYRNAASFCTNSTFNLTNGFEFVWGA